MSDKMREAFDKWLDASARDNGLQNIRDEPVRRDQAFRIWSAALAQAEQRSEAVPVATAHIDRQRLDGSWDMVARFPAPADPSSPDGLPRGGIKVYTAPPSPVVPDAETVGQAVSDHFAALINADGTLAFDPCSSDDIDALVAAMLAAAPEVPRG